MKKMLLLSSLLLTVSLSYSMDPSKLERFKKSLSGIRQERKAEELIYKDKDFSEQFFYQLLEEYFKKQASLKQQETQLMSQKTALETNLNLRKLNLHNKEKDLKKNMQRSTSLLSSVINTVDAVTVFNESSSIANDTNNLQPIQNELSVVLNESSSNMKLHRVFQGLQSEYPVNRLKNPYLKKVNPNNPFIVQANQKESKQYDEALFCLKVTKKAMEYNWSNVSWLQWIWNYRAHHKSMQELDNEIALFEDQDKDVSPEKIVYNRGEEAWTESSMVNRDTWAIKATDGKYYLKKPYVKPQLTHREVFARSNMKQSMFEQVKTARE